jgi:hypothetical protein
MKAYEIFALMPSPLAVEILEFTLENDKEVFQLALGAVAQARKVRPVFLQRQPKKERFRIMVESLGRPGQEAAADNLIRNWLLKKHSQLLIDFLDGLKISHEKGVVEDLPESMDDSTLQLSVENTLAKYPADVVSVYLHAFNHLNGTDWKNLELMVESDARLQF